MARGHQAGWGVPKHRSGAVCSSQFPDEMFTVPLRTLKEPWGEEGAVRRMGGAQQLYGTTGNVKVTRPSLFLKTVKLG